LGCGTLARSEIPTNTYSGTPKGRKRSLGRAMSNWYDHIEIFLMKYVVV
jgi:hypothetical protein